MIKRHPFVLALLASLATALAQTTSSSPKPAASSPVVIQVDATAIKTHVSPTLYGLMTEEINYSYDGGVYAELIRNRTFQDDAQNPVHWSLVQENGGTGAIALDREQPLNAALPVSLKLDVTASPAKARVGVANDGFWGIPLKQGTRYRVSFYARATKDFTGPLTVTLENNDGSTVHASAQIK